MAAEPGSGRPGLLQRPFWGAAQRHSGADGARSTSSDSAREGIGGDGGMGMGGEMAEGRGVGERAPREGGREGGRRRGRESARVGSQPHSKCECAAGRQSASIDASPSGLCTATQASAYHAAASGGPRAKQPKAGVASQRQPAPATTSATAVHRVFAVCRALRRHTSRTSDQSACLRACQPCPRQLGANAARRRPSHYHYHCQP